MLKKVISFVLATSVVASFFVQTVKAEKEKFVEIYVSQNGSDSNPGTKEMPLKTINAAKNKVRELNEAGKLGEKGTTVYIREGIYGVSETLLFEEEDSGTETAPVTYRAYPDEKVQLIGGVNIEKSLFELVTDNKILDRLVSDNAKKSLYRVNLKEIDVNEIPMPYLIGTYSYYEEEGVVQEKSIIIADLVEALGYDRDSAKSPELFVDNELMSVAKYPNDGYLTVGTVTEPGPFMRNWNDDIIGSADWIPPEDRVATPFRFMNKDIKDRLVKWQYADQAIMWGRWWYDWATQSVPLDYVVPETGEIASKVSSMFSVKMGQSWYIYNLLEEIDMPGEYFLDRNSGYLYLYPNKSIEKMDEIVLTLLDGAIVEFNGASNINFQGIDIGRARRNAVVMTKCDNVHISDAEISYTADKAVNIEKSRNCSVKHSYIHDVDGGVYIVECGDMENLVPGNCGVENCEIERFARLTGTYTSAAQLSRGCGNYIRNNEIHDAQHMAVGFTGPYHEVSFNNIYDVCQEADDSGAIYMTRSIATNWGSVIKFNYIHDCTPNVAFNIGTIAVYLDDFMSGVTVSGNVIENMQLGGMFSGYNNEWTNNIFINNSNTALETAYWANISAAELQPTLIEGWKEAEYKTNDKWKNAFPALYAITEDNLKNDTVSTGNIVANNYLWNSAAMNLEQSLINSSDNVVKDNISSAKNPGFVDADNKIYLLKEDAQIYKDLPDFQPIPFTRIGRYENRAMERIKNAVVVAIDSPYVYVNGEKAMINSSEIEQKPLIVDNSTYVPFRFLGEALGTEVVYDDETRNATFNNSAYTLSFSLDSLDKVTKNGEEIQLDVPMKVINGRTYMPLRAISEMIDKEVFWGDCGFITVSDTEKLFNSEVDYGLIDYLHGELYMY